MLGNTRSENAFFSAMEGFFLKAADKAGKVIERDFLICERRLRVRFAGAALIEPFTSAIEHLAAEAKGEKADLTLCAWDSASTGIGLPPCPWPVSRIAADGCISGLDPDSWQAALQIEIGAMSLYDPERDLAFFRIGDAAAMPAREQASPFKAILNWWLRRFGLTMIHGAAVGNGSGAALIVGQSGSGKSTASLACLRGQMSFITDDRCLISLQPGPTAFCIYNSAKLWPEQMERFPELLPWVDAVPSHEGKVVMFVRRMAPSPLAHELPIRVVLLAGIAAQPQTTLSATSPIRILRDLIPSTFIYQPGASAQEMRIMADLVRSVPCRRIHFGTDLDRIPAAIQLAIAEACAKPGPEASS